MENAQTVLAIDKIFEILDNGNWHKLTEVAEKTGTQKSKVELISSFLANYNFLEFDKKTERIRLSNQLQIFLTKIRKIEQEETGEKRRTAVKRLFLF